MNKRINWGRVSSAWAALEREIGPVDFAFSEENAARISAVVDSLLDATEHDAPRPLQNMLEALSNWLSEWESRTVQMPSSDPVELLRHLIESNDLKQRDLAPLLGGQSIVSAILNGRRRINARQAIALGQRFSLSPAAFLPVSVPESGARAASSVSSDQVVEGIDLRGSRELTEGSLAMLPKVDWEQIASSESENLQLVPH